MHCVYQNTFEAYANETDFPKTIVIVLSRIQSKLRKEDKPGAIKPCKLCATAAPCTKVAIKDAYHF